MDAAAEGQATLDRPWITRSTASPQKLKYTRTSQSETTIADADEDASSAADPTAKDARRDHCGIFHDADGLASRRAAMAVVAEQIWALYDAGTPLFTRDALQSVDRQLRKEADVRNGTRNTTVTVCGLNGRQVSLPTQSGVVCASRDHPDIVWVNIRLSNKLIVSITPQIEYWTVEKLTGNAVWHVRHFEPAHAFLPIRIGHHKEARFRDANGVVASTGSRSIADLASSLAQRALTPDALNAQTAESTQTAQAAQTQIDNVRTLFDHHRTQWEASKACKELRATLAPAIARQLEVEAAASAAAVADAADAAERAGPAEPAMPTRKIVAFACSSMAEGRESSKARHAVQHAMILTVRDIVQQVFRRFGRAGGSGGRGEDNDNATRASIECFAQDPAYDPADIAVLGEVGITVVDDPHGFLSVDETTVVVTVAPSVPVRQIVADIARPAAMIWGRVPDESRCGPSQALSALSASASASTTTLAASVPSAPSQQLADDLGGGWSDPTSARVTAMIRNDYVELPFPVDMQNFGTVEGIAIYMRKEPPSCTSTTESSSDIFRLLRRLLLCQPT